MFKKGLFNRAIVWVEQHPRIFDVTVYLIALVIAALIAAAGALFLGSLAAGFLEPLVYDAAVQAVRDTVSSDFLMPRIFFRGGG